MLTSLPATPSGRSLEQSNFSLSIPANSMSAIYILYVLTPNLYFILKETCKIHCRGKLRYEPDRERVRQPLLREVLLQEEALNKVTSLSL